MSITVGPGVAVKTQTELSSPPNNKNPALLLFFLLEDYSIVKDMVLSVVHCWKALSQRLGIWLPTLEMLKACLVAAGH